MCWFDRSIRGTPKWGEKEGEGEMGGGGRGGVGMGKVGGGGRWGVRRRCGAWGEAPWRGVGERGKGREGRERELTAILCPTQTILLMFFTQDGLARLNAVDRAKQQRVRRGGETCRTFQYAFLGCAGRWWRCWAKRLVELARNVERVKLSGQGQFREARKMDSTFRHPPKTAKLHPPKTYHRLC